MSSRRLFAALVCFRVVNALLVRTYFNPDEFWQSTEVAHRLVFG
jgi:phosphatidylinositol glycan class B